VKAADDEAITVGIEQRQREALVSTGVLERVEPDEPDLLEGALAVRLQDRGSGRELVELGRDRIHLVDMGVED
jgi:hypothetical protein